VVEPESLKAWQSIPADFDIGLSEDELQLAEGTYGFVFPPDLREILSVAFPSGSRFPNWRDPSSIDVESQVNAPWHGLVFDIQVASVWPTEWGASPKTLKAKLDHARTWYEGAPKLIPLFGHRYISESPAVAGNPVLSVHQTDIIWYGSDIHDWIEIEFKNKPIDSMTHCPNLSKWSDAMHWRDEV
jgi:hypothetical protein